MTRSSLRLRLLVAWAVFITLLLQVAGVGLRVLFERSITRRTQTELEADLRQLKRGMEVTKDGIITIARAPTDPQFDIVFGGRYWQVEEGNNVLLRSPSLEDKSLDMPPAMKLKDEDRQLWIVGPLKQHLYAVVRNHEVPGASGQPPRELTIITAVDAAEIREDTDKFSSDLFSSLAGLAFLLLAGAWAHVTIGLQPLERIRSSVAAVRAGKTRTIEGDYPEEVTPLIAESNALIEAQDGALSAARERAGDLAHGLKTPLAVMSAKSRELRRQDQCSIADELDRQIEAMRRHVERELARARARGASRTGHDRIDADRLIHELVRAVESLPRGQTLEWETDIPQGFAVDADADDLNNIVGNLVDNAHKWAKSRVRVSAKPVAAGVEIAVEDDGPGVAETDIARVLLRGERADTSVSGSGLGLAIVSDLVALYRGEFMLETSKLGGLKAMVLLPDAPTNG